MSESVYATKMSGWKAWQRDYRLGLILILPPEEIAVRIDRLREEHDPISVATSPAHISLSDPLSREMTPELRDEILGILTQIPPFELHFGKPIASSRYAGVSHPVGPQEAIDTLKAALHVSSAFHGRPYKRRSIPAHMTIAEFLSIDDGLRLCDQLQATAPGGSFVCEKLSFLVPDEQFVFRLVDEFALGPRPTA